MKFRLILDYEPEVISQAYGLNAYQYETDQQSFFQINIMVMLLWTLPQFSAISAFMKIGQNRYFFHNYFYSFLSCNKTILSTR